MNKITKKSDLHREYARVLDMVEGTNIKPWDCVKYDALSFDSMPMFNSEVGEYEFAISIVDDKPVFIGDVLYNKENGKELIIKEASYHNKISGNTYYAPFIYGDIIENYSWNPQKTKNI